MTTWLAKARTALERGRVRLLLAGAGSLLLHLLLSIWFAAHEQQVAPPPVDQARQLEVHTVERPPPALEPTSRSLPPMRVQRLPRVKRSVPPPPRAERSMVSPPQAAPPPERPAKAPLAPVHIGVTLESTTSGGSFAVPVGRSSPDGEAPEGASMPSGTSSDGDRPYWATKYVPQAKVTELPVLLDEVKAAYPPEARRAGLEGNVVLMLTIDDHGAVARVRKISGVSPDLDQAAIAAVKRFRFRPARYAGAAVATEIRYVYAFEIN